MALPVADLLMQKGCFCTLRLPEALLVEPYGLIRVRGRPLSPSVWAFYLRLKNAFLPVPKTVVLPDASHSNDIR